MRSARMHLVIVVAGPYIVPAILLNVQKFGCSFRTKVSKAIRAATRNHGEELSSADWDSGANGCGSNHVQ